MVAPFLLALTAGSGAAPSVTPVSDITLSANSIAENAPQGTVVGTLSNNLGTSVSWAITDNSDFQLSASTGTTVTLQRSGTGTIAEGVSESVTIRATASGASAYDENFSVTVTEEVSETLLTTITLHNTSGGTIPAGAVTPMFGHPFKNSDIASGTYPQFRSPNGQNCDFSFLGRRSRNNGSWKWSGFAIRTKEDISAGGMQVISIYNGGSAPSAPSVGISDISARDFKVTLTGLDNLSGSWVSSLTQGITDNDELLDISGLSNAGGNVLKFFRVRQQFMQSAANHGQLESYHYVAVLQDASNGVGGFRWLPRVVQPWYDVDSPTKNKRDFNWTLADGGSTIATMSPGAACQFTWDSGSNFLSSNNTLSTGVAGRLTTTGTLPTGLSTGTTYYISPDPGSGVDNRLYFCPTALDAVVYDHKTTVSGAGSGIHTFTPHTEIVHFASVFGATADGKYQFIQGGGSFTADAPIHIEFDKAYWKATEMLPTYMLSVEPDPNPTQTYTPNTRAQLRAVFNATGPDQQIGPQPVWVARAFMNQTEADLNGVRVNGLCYGNIALCVKNSSTGTMPVVTATSGTPFTGMGTASATFRWSTANSNGFTAPSGDNAGIYLATDGSHWGGGAAYYAYLATGEPQYFDLQAETANYLTFCRQETLPTSTNVNDGTPGPRNNATLGIYGFTQGETGGGDRDDAWSFLMGCLASGIRPDVTWEKAALGSYLDSLVQSNLDFFDAFNALQDSFWNDNGWFWFFDAYPLLPPWMYFYKYFSWCFADGVLEGACSSQLTHLSKFVESVHANVDIFHMTGYRCLCWESAGTMVTSMDQMFFSPGGGTQWSFDSGTDLLTYIIFGNKATYTLNDKFMCQFSSPGAWLPPFTEYNVVTLTDPGTGSDKTFKISATPSPGSPVNITTDPPPNLTENVGIRYQTIPTDSWGMDYSNINGGYTTIGNAALNMGAARGQTGIAAAKAAMNTYISRMPAYPDDFVDVPTWALDDTYAS